MDFTFNFRGNLKDEALKSAGAVDALTIALRNEEIALRRQQAIASGKGPFSAQARKGLEEYAKTSKIKTASIKADIADLKASAQIKTLEGGQGFFGTLEKSRGPIGGLVKDAKALGEAFSGNKWAMAAVGIVAVTGVVLALGKAVVSAASDAALFAIKIADAARNTRLLNQAADIAGGTHSQLGAIIKGVAEGPTTLGKDRIGEMAREMRILRFDSRQTQLAVSAMATAESALGAGASGAIKSIAEQSREAKRFVLGARDMYREYTGLKGTGLGKKDVFAALSKQLGVSVTEAEERFRRGGVTIRQGLQAIEEATKAKFGGVVEDQLLGLDVQFMRMKEDIGGLFAGVNITPLLKGLRLITGIFSDTTAGGRATRLAITGALDDLAAKAAKIFPYVESFLYGFGAGAFQVYTEDIKPLLDSFSSDIETDGIEGAFKSGEVAAKGLATTLVDVAKALKEIADLAVTVSKGIGFVAGGFGVSADQQELDAINAQLKMDRAAKDLSGGDTKDAFVNAGRAMTIGVADGIRLGSPEAIKAMEFMSSHLLGAFKAANEIKSPSKLYERTSEYIPEGSAKGIEKRTPVVQEAIEDMAAPNGALTSVKSGGSGSFRAEVTINLMMSDGSVRREVRDILFEAADAGPSRA